jgi:hypothetical protein
MRAAWIAIALAACGHAARTAPPPLANTPPPTTTDAGVVAEAADEDAATDPDAEDADDDAFQPECTPGDALPMHVDGKDTPVHLDVCTTGEHREGPPDSGFVLHDRTATLVLDRAEPLRTTVADWQDGWEDGSTYTLVGVLRAHGGGDSAVLIAVSSYGPADGLDGVNGALLVYAVQDGAWQQVHTVDARVVTARIAKNQRYATVETCDPPAQGTGTGGGACEHYDGDGRTFALRWEGGKIREYDVTSTP